MSVGVCPAERSAPSSPLLRKLLEQFVIFLLYCGDGTTMRRRTFIAGSAGVLGALAGCATLGGDGGSSGPTDPVESFVEGYAANDTNATRAAVHPDGPLVDDLPRSVDDRQLELANATVVSETNGTATIEANVSVRGSVDQWHEPREFEVREREGDWRIWSMATGPELALETYFEALEAGRTDDALDGLHADSPDREWIDSSIVESATPSLESASLAAFWDDEATLDVAFTEAVGEATSERSRQVELRRTAEGWQVWSLRFGPVVAVYEYVRAINENDPEAFEAVIHPDSAEGSSDVTESNLQPLSASVQSVQIAAGPENGEATVETELEVTAQFMGQEQTQTQSTDFEVRTHGGDWLLYQ